MSDATTTGRTVPDRMLERLRSMATVERVFGAPIERDGAVVIPVARIMAGGGGGSGDGGAGDRDGEGVTGSGEGGGFGLRAKPAGVYVLRNGKVRWMPAVDPGRMVALSGATAIAALAVAWAMQRERTRALRAAAAAR